MENLNEPRNYLYKLTSFILAIVIIATLALYLLMPFRPVEKVPQPHALLFLQALQDEDFVQWVWYGVDLPQTRATGERFIAFAIGSIFFFSLLAIGRALLTPWLKTLGDLRVDKIGIIYFSGVLGLVALATISLFLGLIGRANAPILLPLCAAVPLAFAAIYFCNRKHKRTDADADAETSNLANARDSLALSAFKIALLALFVSFYLFAGVQPLFEYDAVEYHAQGAREFYETGVIGFVAHNVYMNMPLGAETFYLAGFNLSRDLGFSEQDVLRIGSLIGKTTLAYATLLTALGIAGFCRRFFASRSAAYWSALTFLSFPVLFENVSNGLNDSVLALALFSIVFLLALESARARNCNSRRNLTSVLSYASLLGVLLGFAISIKYTAVPFILAPTLLFVLIIELVLRRNAAPSAPSQQPYERVTKSVEAVGTSHKFFNLAIALCLVFIITLVVGGGWYFKNYVATGNPVYPLAYDLFGDSTGLWNDAVNERWTRAHSPDSFALEKILNAVVHAFWLDNYASAFFFYLPIIFVALTVVTWRRHNNAITCGSFANDRNVLTILFALVLIYVLAWILCTHRIARFLIPITPLLAPLLGGGVASVFSAKNILLKVLSCVAVLTILCYSGLIIDMIGQGRLAPLTSLERDPDRYSGAAIYFNDHPEMLGKDEQLGKLLLVGEAKAFDYRVPVLYSTCWNDSPFMPALKDAIKFDGETVKEITKPEKVRRALAEMGVKYILVDFDELARFRSEGNYGFNNPELNESLFQALVVGGIIELVEDDDLKLLYYSKLFRVVSTPDED